MNQNNEVLTFSKDDTLFLKGFAILVAIAHHLFYKQYGLYDDIDLLGFPLVQSIVYQCKFPISIFVFLSAYGLSAQAKKIVKWDLKSFYLKRFIKLYFNYWLVFAIFVPIGVFVFGRSLGEAYGDCVIVKFIADFFGLISVVGVYGYNPTWWYYAAILILYFCFPFLYKMAKYRWWLPLLVSLVVFVLHHNPTFLVRMLFPVFVLGILFYMYPIPKKGNAFIWAALLLLAFAGRFLIPNTVTGIQYGLLYDVLLVALGMILYKHVTMPVLVNKFVMFAGEHSMNIFLFHTFIYYYWFRDFIYMSRNPIIIYLSLLFSCLVISIALQRFKKLINFDTFVSNLAGKY